MVPKVLVRCLAGLMAIVPGGLLNAQVTTRTDAVGKLLNEWYAAGTASGLAAITYENRDGEHSMLEFKQWPQLKVHIAPKGESGPAGEVRQFPIIGNCSMASAANDAGSLPRIYMTAQEGFNFLAGQYIHNNLFVYPEHQDYDPGWNGRGGWGDLFPANTPALTISQGSSTSDLPFVRAFLSTTAALPPDVLKLVTERQMLAPTLQALLRRSYKAAPKDEDYFTGRAHPVVFDGNLLDEAGMVRLAHEMTVEKLPPVVSLQITGESESEPARNFFEVDSVRDQKLGTTPFCIARIFRSSGFIHQMLLGTQGSVDVLGRPLKFRWVVLRGDPKRVRLEPSPDNATAKLTVAWQAEFRAPDGIQSHRVDVGIFADNGASWSAPSIVSIYMLPNEARFYDPKGRAEEICYDAGNPDPGLPPGTDLRWMAFGWRMGNDQKHAGIALLSHYMPEVAIVRLQSLVDDLSDAQDAWRKLTVDPALKPQADKALSELQQKLREGLDSTFDNSGRTVAQAFEDGIRSVAEVSDLYLAGQDVIPGLVQSCGKPNAVNAFLAARQRLLDFRILTQDAPGHFAPLVNLSALTAGEKYHLTQFHLTVLNLALLPDFLDRVEATAYVDTRLTTPKAWRDLYRYTDDGKPNGWTRIMAGKSFEFDADGRLLPQGHGGPAVPVKYVRDEKTGRLLFVPQS